MSKNLALITVVLISLSSFPFYSVPAGLAQSISSSPTFTVSIDASINGYSSTCVFGVNPDTSTILASYPNSGVWAYFTRHNPSTFEADKLSQFIVPSNGSTTWRLVVMPIDQEGTLTLAWSQPTVASLIFRDIFGIVNVDMNAVRNFSFETIPGGVSNFDIIYQSPKVLDTIPPSIEVLTPIENKTYDTHDLALNFTVNEPAQMSYGLDGKDNVSISGNTTLTGLANGNHSVAVYATDEAGNTGASETLTFTVNVPEPEPKTEPFPFVPVVVAVSAVAVVSVGAGLLLYNRKRRKEAQQK